MVNKVTCTYRGLNQDVTKSKHPFEFYYGANNIRIITTDTQSTASVTNEKGNSLKVTIPNISIDLSTNVITYGTETLSFNNSEIATQHSLGLPLTSNSQKIIGHSVTRNNVILFTTDESMDCIWEIEEILGGSFRLKLLYVRSLEFSINNPIQTIYNYENKKIEKIYWVDGNKQLRFINIRHSIANGDLEELIDINSNTINLVGNYLLSQPNVTNIVSGGQHTSGKIQYAYNLYRLNSSQTTISPLTDLVPLDKGRFLGGGEVNEEVGSSPIVQINNIDPNYTHLKLYAIKYTSYNETPQVSLIANIEVDASRNFTYYDDGNIIFDLSLEEFIFLGSDPIIPKHIDSKDNILFSANITEKSFTVDLDCRAYGYPQNATVSYVLENVVARTGSAFFPPNITPGITGNYLTIFDYDDVPEKHDAINPNYDIYTYQYNSSVIGGEGKYLKYELTQNVLNEEDSQKGAFFKDEEIYRISIEFYNTLGQKSFANWIADFKVKKGNLINQYNGLKVQLKSEFYTWLTDPSNFDTPEDKPVGYRIIRADRTLNDMTIMCQGSINGMISNGTDVTLNNSAYDLPTTAVLPAIEPVYIKGTIMPSFQRIFDDSVYPMMAVDNARKLNPRSDANTNPNGPDSTGREVYGCGCTGDFNNQVTWQFNKLMQIHSPDVLFGSVSLPNNLQLRIKGGQTSSSNEAIGREVDLDTTLVERSFKISNGINIHQTGIVVESSTLGNSLQDRGLIAPPGNNDDEGMDFYQFYREFKGGFEESNGLSVPVYAKPELTQRGQQQRAYNNDSTFKYTNNMLAMLTDGNSEPEAIITVNSYGTQCVSVVLGPDDPTLDISQRIYTLDYLFNSSGLSQTNTCMIAELHKPKTAPYLENIYGGATYESKRRNTYIQIGDYKPINQPTADIVYPGDTFVSDFHFVKMGKTEVEVLNGQTTQYTEILKYRVETLIDLKNRNDLSLGTWDAEFQPTIDSWEKYNRVYSQQNITIVNTAELFNFKAIRDYDTRVLASKIKVPGEDIDSWTDFTVNEEKNLDGKYGPINGLTNFNDTLFAFQDNGIASLTINPRIQIQASDGEGIELGRGNILYDYKYITNKSGAINKWSILSTPSGFYYYDALNRSLMRYSSEGLEGLTDKFGLHSYFTNNVNYNNIVVDNPLIGSGVLTAYNPTTNDIYLTVLQEGNNFTLAFNEFTNSFTSFYSYTPSMYIIKGFTMLTTNPNINSLWEHFNGDYNSFYGIKYDSDITLIANPQENDCVFNNISYKSELYLNDVDQPKQTLTSIKAYNEYQETAETPLILHSNINRKFRVWRANIPRSLNNGNPSLDRMRGHWVFITLKLENPNNYKLVLHDVNVHYTANQY